MQAERKEILFIVQYPENVSPGQRFRFELYKDLLYKNGFNVTTHSFIESHDYRHIFKSGFIFKKSIAVLKGFLRRFTLLFKVKKYSFIFLQLGVAPLGPPVFEWVLIKLLKKKRSFVKNRNSFQFRETVQFHFNSKLKNPQTIFEKQFHTENRHFLFHFFFLFTARCHVTEN